MQRAIALVAAVVAAVAVTAAAIAIPNRGGGNTTGPRSEAALKAKAAARQARAEARMQAIAERAARANTAKMKRCHRDLAATDV